MPAWIINLIISLAVKFGLPWVLKLFPALPEWLRKIIEELLSALKEPQADKKEIVKEAHIKVKKACSGSACPADTVKE